MRGGCPVLSSHLGGFLLALQGHHASILWQSFGHGQRGVTSERADVQDLLHPPKLHEQLQELTLCLPGDHFGLQELAGGALLLHLCPVGIRLGSLHADVAQCLRRLCAVLDYHAIHTVQHAHHLSNCSHVLSLGQRSDHQVRGSHHEPIIRRRHLLALGVRQAYLRAVLFNSASLPWVGEANALVFLQSLQQHFLRQVIEVAGLPQWPWDGRGEVAASLFYHGHLGPPYGCAVLHDGMPKAQLAI
mmetsp:Transcript_59730/g.96666  ORF Transcript_59730/g.96666 Transcript_59730/m.96666 type:complete len:245 (-) Transcript_59730:697-1431(-)